MDDGYQYFKKITKNPQLYIWRVATFVTCPITFSTYKYSELQVFDTTQKLSCKANCKTPFLIIVLIGEGCHLRLNKKDHLITLDRSKSTHPN